MKLIACIDDQNGLAFNHRRQSRDRLLIDDLVRHLNGQTLHTTAYSAKLFEGKDAKIEISDAPAEVCGGGYCFLETVDPAPYADRIDTVILYRWNRRYPSDVTFGISLSRYRLIRTEEFVGSSHEKITKEIWKR